MADDQHVDPQPQSQDGASIAIGILVLPLALFIFCAGNAFMVERVAGWINKPWLSEFVDQHFIWANIVYLLICYAVAFPAIWFIQLQEKTGRSIFLIPALALGLPFVATILVGYYRAYVITRDYAGPVFYRFIEDYGLKIPLFLFVVVGAPTLAYLAYRLRGTNQTLYGVIELVFGLGFILFSVYSVALAPFLTAELTNPDLWKTIFSFFTGVYIIVRGLVNIEDGLDRGPLESKVIFGLLSELLAKLLGRRLFSSASAGHPVTDEEETG